MWYEILIPSGIMVGLLGVPSVVCPYINIWQLGNIFNRYTDDKWVEFFWFRDHHITGDSYKPNGIATLPDEPPEQYRKKK